MIQCVGSRNKEAPYCSRVCCSKAVKNAIEIKKATPTTEVYILHKDIRTYGFREDLYRRRASWASSSSASPRTRTRVVSKDGEHFEVIVDGHGPRDEPSCSSRTWWC